MKRIFSVMFALVLVLTLSLVTAAPVSADTLNVPGTYTTIQDAIDDASDGDTIVVAEGEYDGFTVDAKTNLTIKSSSSVNVTGVEVVTTAYGDRDVVVFVKDSTNIVLDGLTVGPNTGKTLEKDYGVVYENSSGEIKDCTVSPDTSGDMKSTAIGIWDESDVTVDPCTIKDFGRIGVFIYNGCTASVLDSTIEGQVYSDGGKVCYGIEVEGAYMDATPGTGSQVTIRGNEIYNCDNTFDPSPSWGSSAILINGWLEYYDADDSTVIVEENDIHDNYAGIYVIKSPSSYAHNNNIYDNRDCGVESAKAYDDSTAVFDAENNWWGATNGPSGVGPGDGDAVSTDVDYEPWLLGLWTGSTVGMTTIVPDIAAISIDPTSIDFGTLLPGQTSATFDINVQNIGTRTVTVDAWLTGSSAALFKSNLEMRLDGSGAFSKGSGSPVTWEDIITGLIMSNSTYVQTRLPVPSDYTPKGGEEATLIFEATAE